MKQRTIHRETSIKGKGLHTGEQVQMTFKPAPDNHGVIFRRVDLYGKPEIKPRADVVSDINEAKNNLQDLLYPHY